MVEDGTVLDRVALELRTLDELGEEEVASDVVLTTALEDELVPDEIELELPALYALSDEEIALDEAMVELPAL